MLFMFDITCFGEEFEATGQTGQFQSWTESEAKVTATIACAVETTRLQNPKERFESIFLSNRNPIDHETIPGTITFLITWSSIFASETTTNTNFAKNG